MNNNIDSIRSAQRTQRIGVVSINPKPNPYSSSDFQHVYSSVGKNTGNLMFTQAMYSLLDGDITHIGFLFDAQKINKDFDIVVIPAANWLNRNADWDWFLERLESLTIPAVIIGLGIQADDTSGKEIEVSDSAERLVKFFSDNSPLISVRGELTKEWLAKRGILNVVATGCPSLYMNIFQTDANPALDSIVLQSTRYFSTRAFSESSGINRLIFSLSAQFGTPIVFQSEAEEMELLLSGKSVMAIEENRRSALLDIYGIKTSLGFDEFIRINGRVFFSLHEWSDFLRRHAGVIGTRLHGSILSLNSGRKALIIPHDSRTSEIAQLAAIPSTPSSSIAAVNSLEELVTLLFSANLERYQDRRSMNQIRFIQFLRDVGLRARLENMF